MIGALFPIIHLGRAVAVLLADSVPESAATSGRTSARRWCGTSSRSSPTSPAASCFSYCRSFPTSRSCATRPPAGGRRFYGTLALGWQGTTKQWHRLESAMQIMAIAIIPVAVSVHTIVSFDFSMAIVPVWHSTIFGPYFVGGRDLQRHRRPHHRHGRCFASSCTSRTTCTRCTSRTSGKLLLMMSLLCGRTSRSPSA